MPVRSTGSRTAKSPFLTDCSTCNSRVGSSRLEEGGSTIGVESPFPLPVTRAMKSPFGSVVLLQKLSQGLGIDRLDDVRVEAGLEGAAAIFRLAVTRHRDQSWPRGPLERAQPL